MTIEQTPTKEKTPSPSPHLTKQIKTDEKKRFDAIFSDRDDLSLRIEMARMSGIALQLSDHKLADSARHPMLTHIIRDLKQLYRDAPREALMLRERLLTGEKHKAKDPATFQGTLFDPTKPNLSNLAVR